MNGEEMASINYSGAITLLSKGLYFHLKPKETPNLPTKTYFR